MMLPVGYRTRGGTMHRLLLNLPTRLETDRLLLRPYAAGDGDWYYAASLRNREHLSRYE